MSELLRIVGVVGDIHAHDHRLTKAVELFDRIGVDRVLSVGDITDGPGDLAACCALLQAREVVAVRGNHDRWLFENALRDLHDAHEADDLDPSSREFLRHLPATRDLMTSAGRLLLCHGLGDDDMTGVYPGDFGYGLEVNDRLQRLIRRGDYRFVVNGHTHLRMVRSFGGLTIINAGSLANNRRVMKSGEKTVGPLFDPGDPCALVVDFANLEVQPYCFGSDDTLVAIDPVPLPDGSARRPSPG